MISEKISKLNTNKQSGMRVDFCIFWRVHVLVATLLFLPQYGSAQANNQNSKRGLAYHTPTDPDDFALFFSDNSTISWYHNWSPNPSRIPQSAAHPIEFLPMIHGTSNLRGDLAAIERLGNSDQNPSRKRHVLTFNEPDGSVDSGGSDISPEDAAEAYLRYILPLRSEPYNLLISHPVVTGSGNGLNWLRAFNDSCHNISPDTGCPTDFVAAHFYGAFEGLASWLGQINAFYNADPKNPRDLPIYVTEFALPQASAQATEMTLNSSLPYLDNLTYVGGYAWFGMFRTNEANEWTGAGNAMLDGNGALTNIGAEYLGGSAAGFAQGQRGDAASLFGPGWFNDGASGDGNGGGRGGYGSGGPRKRAWRMIVNFMAVWCLVWMAMF